MVRYLDDKLYKNLITVGCILAPTLYNSFTSDISNLTDTYLATFVDDTAIIFYHLDSD